MPPRLSKKPPTQIPSVTFVWEVETTTYGVRVRWQSHRDSLHHPESFEVVASAEGVRVCGHSPVLDLDSSDDLCRILGAANAAVGLIREGLPPHTIRAVLEESELKFEEVQSGRAATTSQ